jgi:hypothetical protein
MGSGPVTLSLVPGATAVRNRSATVTVATPRGPVEVVRQEMRGLRHRSSWTTFWLARRKGRNDWAQADTAREAIRRATLLTPRKPPPWLLEASADAQRMIDDHAVPDHDSTRNHPARATAKSPRATEDPGNTVSRLHTGQPAVSVGISIGTQPRGASDYVHGFSGPSSIARRLLYQSKPSVEEPHVNTLTGQCNPNPLPVRQLRHRSYAPLSNAIERGPTPYPSLQAERGATPHDVHRKSP